MMSDKKKDELSSTVSQFRKKGLINDVSYYGSSFLGQLSSPTELIAGLGIGTVAKSGIITANRDKLSSPLVSKLEPLISTNSLISALLSSLSSEE
jgi:hypothetical protein